jgi:hypothetical protein
VLLENKQSLQNPGTHFKVSFLYSPQGTAQAGVAEYGYCSLLPGEIVEVCSHADVAGYMLPNALSKKICVSAR